MSPKKKGCFLMILSGFFYGLAPVLILKVSRTGASSYTGGLMIRYTVTTLLLLPFAIRSACRRPMPYRQLGQTVLSGVLTACTAASLYTSYRWLPGGVGMAVSYLYPLFVLLLGAAIYHRRITAYAWLVEAMALVGIGLMCDLEALQLGAWKGVAFAVLSALSFAAYIMWGEAKRLSKLDPIVYTGIVTGTAALGVALFNLLTGQFRVSLSPDSLFWFLLVGIDGALAVATQITSLRYIDSATASVLGTLELVVCCVGSALYLKEPFPLRSAAGAALLVLAVVLFSLRDQGGTMQGKHGE